MKNRRKHPRLPIIKDLAKEVFISTDAGFFPALLMNLSAGGIYLMMHSELKPGTQVCLIFDFDSLKTDMITGKVVRNEKKNLIWNTAIAFTDMKDEDFQKIIEMSEDFTDCENKISLGVTDVCDKSCRYFSLCEKPLKLKK
ncbi:MAG: PilZ domain-containing protein [Elusimicrobia bacterium]|nr:PilZ domain-containing protein [Elusimicrobiota bacterium]